MAYQFQLGTLNLPLGASIDTTQGDIELGLKQVDPADMSVDSSQLQFSKFTYSTTTSNTATPGAADKGDIEFVCNSKYFKITFADGSSTSGFTTGAGTSGDPYVMTISSNTGGNSANMLVRAVNGLNDNTNGFASKIGQIDGAEPDFFINDANTGQSFSIESQLPGDGSDFTRTAPTMSAGSSAAVDYAVSKSFYLGTDDAIASASPAQMISAMGITADAAELNHVDGVTSSIQTQLDAKHPTIDSDARLSATLIGADGNVSDTEYGYLANVSSDIQAQMNSAAMTKANLTSLMATYDGTETLTIGDDGNDMTLVIKGTLQVDGTTTTVNSTTVQIDDLNLQLADGAAAASAVNGGGITLANSGTDFTFAYNHATTAWKSSIDMDLANGKLIKINGTEVLSADGAAKVQSAVAGTGLTHSAGALAVTSLGITTGLLADDAVDGTKIADDAVDSEHIADGAIDLAHMSANSVDSDQYVDGSIDLAHMSANSVDSDQYVDGSIDLAHMSANSVDSDQYVDGSIDTVHIADAQITLAKMAANSVDSDQYVDGSIDTVHIADAQITLAKMAANSVDSDQYVDASIDNVHLANSAVTLSQGAGMAAMGSVSLGGSVTVAVDGVLEDLDTLGAASNDGEFMVATGAGVFAYESGNTARTSLGLGTGDSPEFTGLTLTGNLTVNGTTTAINSTTLTVDDKNIEMGSVDTPTDTTANGGGITLKGATDKTIIWDSANANWTSSEDWNIASDKVFRVDDAEVLSATTLGSSVLASSLTSVGTITSGVWSGTALVKGKQHAQTSYLDASETFAGAKTFSAASQFNSTIILGADDQGYDVKFYGDTASAYMLWDTSADDLILAGAAGLVVPEGQFSLGSTAVTSTAAELNLLDGSVATVDSGVANGKAAIYSSRNELHTYGLKQEVQVLGSGTGSIIDEADGYTVVILANASQTYNLPLAAVDNKGCILRIKNAGENSFSLEKNSGNAVNTLEGQDAVTMDINAAITCICIYNGDAGQYEWIIM